MTKLKFYEWISRNENYKEWNIVKRIDMTWVIFNIFQKYPLCIQYKKITCTENILHLRWSVDDLQLKIGIDYIHYLNFDFSKSFFPIYHLLTKIWRFFLSRELLRSLSTISGKKKKKKKKKRKISTLWFTKRYESSVRLANHHMITKFCHSLRSKYVNPWRVT